MRWMGLDIGDKTIGVAVSDPLFLTAQGVTTIERVGIRKDTTKVVDYIKEYVGWIAPVYIYENEVEQEAMCSGALRVLRGKEEPKIYTGKGMV